MSGFFTNTLTPNPYNKWEIWIMHDANGSQAECIKNNFEFVISPAGGCICKQTKNWK